MTRRDVLEMLDDWNLWGSYGVQSIERPEYLARLGSASRTGEIVTVKGVRRGGKSTILFQHLRKLVSDGVPAKNTLVVNFEDPRFGPPTLDALNRIYETYLASLLPEGRQYVVLDEVQETPGWEKFARFLSESGKAGVFVTGSSSKMLSGEYATLLSGRHLDISVFPLSFGEFLRFKGLSAADEAERTLQRHKIRNLLNEYMETGGFPKVVLIEKPEKRSLLESYFNDILIKDVQKRFKIRETGKLEALARYYLANISTIQPFNRVRRPIGLSLDSVQRFSGHFSLAGFFYFVRKFSFSLKEQMLNPRKVYAADVGFRDAAGFRFSRDMGRIMENLVFLELMRRGREVFYWKSARGKEIDFVVRFRNKMEELIQVCCDPEDPATLSRELGGLEESMNDLKCARMRVITEDYEGEEKLRGRQRVGFIPLWKWLLAGPE
ncbi:MAG: ATP-binding protein [Elusimicrobia bacterium]|nr:ATP-binding protein [Elusimicrobiota bacterium]